jgi:hypothetical protein
MDEQQMQDDDRRNDSGIDDYEAWVAMKNKQAEEENENKRNNK